MFFKLMEVRHYLGCEADETFITTVFVSIVMLIELVFSFNGLMASFTLKGLILGFKWDSVSGWREGVYDII